MSVVYPYTVHTLPTSAKDALSKLRSFMITQGWTSEEYQTSVDWASDGDGTYSWHAGSDDFLQISSDGYGSQVLRVRILVEYDSGYANHYRWHCHVIDPTAGSNYLDTTSTNPVDQDRMGDRANYNWMSVPSGSFNELYLFGNDKWILIGFRCTSTTYITCHFGTPELYSEYQDTTEIAWGPACASRVDNDFYWDELDSGLHTNRFFTPFVLTTAFDLVWWRAASRDSGYMRYNIYTNTANGLAEFWNDLLDVVQVNSWTGKRIMQQPLVLLLNTSSVWEPVGHHPCHFIRMSGLSLGETLTYGTEQYMCFPVPVYGAATGHAIRIA